MLIHESHDPIAICSSPTMEIPSTPSNIMTSPCSHQCIVVDDGDAYLFGHDGRLGNAACR
jgi:hypothetical protein